MKEMLKLGPFQINPSKIVVVRVDKQSRDENNNYIVTILVWCDGHPTPFTQSYELLKPEYDGKWYRPKKLKLLSPNEVLEHPKLNKKVLQQYIDDLKMLGFSETLFSKGKIS